jgi:hypothetical protein
MTLPLETASRPSRGDRPIELLPASLSQGANNRRIATNLQSVPAAGINGTFPSRPHTPLNFTFHHIKTIEEKSAIIIQHKQTK